MSKKNVAIILSSCAQMANSPKPTGFHYEEMSGPFWVFKDAGFEVTLSSVRGGQAPHDPSSLQSKLDDNPESIKRFMEDGKAMEDLHHTKQISEIDINTIDAVFLAGGHGTMWDFPNNADLGKLLSEAYEQKKPIAAVCHGVAGLIGAEDASGNPIVAGKRINSFTNDEEKEVDLQDTVPFLLQTALCELGAKFKCSENFSAHVEIDGRLITGQNPASAEGVAKELVSQLTQH